MSLWQVELDYTRTTAATGEHRATLLGYVATPKAQSSAEAAGSGTTRPAYVAIAGEEHDVRTIAARARAGRRLVVSGAKGTDRHRLELLRSDAYRWLFTSPASGTLVAEAYYPPLFELEHHEQDGGRVAFLVAVPAWWAAAEFGGDGEAAAAAWFWHLVDHRTAVPLPGDLAFARHLWESAQRCRWCHRPSGRYTSPGRLYQLPEGAQLLGTLAALRLVDVDAATLAQFLAGVIASHVRSARLGAVERRPLPTPMLTTGPAGPIVEPFEFVDVEPAPLPPPEVAAVAAAAQPATPPPLASLADAPARPRRAIAFRPADSRALQLGLFDPVGG